MFLAGEDLLLFLVAQEGQGQLFAGIPGIDDSFDPSAGRYGVGIGDLFAEFPDELLAARLRVRSRFHLPAVEEVHRPFRARGGDFGVGPGEEFMAPRFLCFLVP